ncbi:MAG TPA: dihydroorotase [bacterium]|nr:dihydroorotase [bacterium]
MKKSLTKSQTFCRNSAPPTFRFAKKILLKNATLIGHNYDERKKFDVLIIDGKIRSIASPNEATDDFAGEQIELAGKLVLPGFFDMHVHFREPGREDEETLRSGAAAAMAGGFTAVATMPNTDPVTDNQEIVEFIKDELRDHLITVHPIAAITRRQLGKELVDMAELIEAGVVAFSDDGKSVLDSLMLRRALEYAQMFDVPIIEHCEDPFLAYGGDMHEGFVSSNLGLPGIPAIAEDIVVARNILLAEYTRSKMHIAHISTAGAVELVRRAKDKGLAVTAEATPHHFTLTDEAVSSFDANFKMNPPLRSPEHVNAIIAGLKEGVIDAIATDHAPHSIEEKDTEFSAAPFGILGLETALGLAIKQLIKPGIFNWGQLVEKMSANPYRILGLEAPEIKPDVVANLTIIDPDIEWTVDKTKFKSRSRNTPFHDWKLQGKVHCLFNNGYFYLNPEF